MKLSNCHSGLTDVISAQWHIQFLVFFFDKTSSLFHYIYLLFLAGRVSLEDHDSIFLKWARRWLYFFTHEVDLGDIIGRSFECGLYSSGNCPPNCADWNLLTRLAPSGRRPLSAPPSPTSSRRRFHCLPLKLDLPPLQYGIWYGRTVSDGVRVFAGGIC